MSIKAEHISYTYQKKTPFANKALTDISLEIKRGSFTGIIGHTGCGKSTLLQHFNGILMPDEGSIYIDGEKMTEKNVRELRKKVGLVFQYPEYQLFEDTVYKDVLFGIKKEKISDEEKKQRVLDALDIVGISPDFADKSIYDLSGGQKRRVALAGVIVMQPEYLVLDEPAAGLDPEGRDEILGYVKRLQEERGTTIILVSHSMEDIARLADHVIVMGSGQKVMDGTVAEIFGRGSELSALGLAVPQITVMWEELRTLDPELPDDIYTVEAAAEAIKACIEAHTGGGGT